MKYLKIIISSFLLFLYSQKLNAQVGTLDPSFGDGGIEFLDPICEGYVSTVLEDGKILTVGSYETTQVSIWRFNADGTLDESFGVSGRVDYSFGKKFQVPHAMALQNDGKILVTGEYYATSGGIQTGIMRCNSDGSLDSSFGNNGLDSVHINKWDYSYGIVVQKDGKIVVAGITTNTLGIAKASFLARFMPDGGLDNSFGVNGNIVTNYSSLISIVTLAIKQNGKLLTGGDFNSNSDHPVYQVIQYNTNGNIDDAFGENGKAQFVFGQGQGGQWANKMNAMSIAPDDKIICIGSSGNPYVNMAVCRFNADGTIDNEFGDNGGVITPYNNLHDVENISLAFQPDGKILTTALINIINTNPMILTRYENNGQLDVSFGENGFTSTEISYYPRGNSIHVLPDSKILVTGYTDLESRIFLARYNGDNVLSANFKDLKAAQNKDAITVTWQTLNESGRKSFTVERSGNANEYVGINTVPAKGVASNYSYTDKNPLDGISYYRIRENAANGTNTYSPVVKIVFNDNGVISLYPNPAKNTVTVKGLNKNIPAVIKITDMQGREISSQNFTQSSSATLNLRALAQGAYFVQIAQEGKIVRLKLIKE